MKGIYLCLRKKKTAPPKNDFTVEDELDVCGSTSELASPQTIDFNNSATSNTNDNNSNTTFALTP